MKTRSKTLLSTLLLVGIAAGASATEYVFLADNALAGPTAPTFQPFSTTIQGLFHNGDIDSGTTTLADALTYTARPAGNGTSPGHDNGRFEPALFVQGSNTVTHTFSTPLELSGMLLWNYNEYWDGLSNDRGITRADIIIIHDGGTNTLEDVAIALTPSIDGEDQLSSAQQFNFGATYTGVSAIILGDLERGGTAHMGWKDTAFISPSPIAPTPPVWADPIVVGEGIAGVEYTDTLDGQASDINDDPITYSRDSSGPAWLNVASDGTLSGIPSTTGTNTFQVIATAAGDATSGTLHIAVRGSLPPVWTEPVTSGDATVNKLYGGKIEATDPDGETITYSLVDTDTWLSVATNGILSGTPATSDLGTNTFTVVADDGRDTPSSAMLTIVVKEPVQVGRLISIDFNNTTDANWTVIGTQTAGPLDSANWNTTSTAAGGPQALIDNSGAATTATITWSAANTWNAGDQNATTDKRINHVYLDDGNGGASITLTNIPYGQYRVYGLLASADGPEYSARNFEVNGSWVWGTERNDQADAYGTIDGAIAGSGSSWTEIERGVTRGNYWTFETYGSNLVVNGIDRWDGGRGSISGIIIEEIAYVPDGPVSDLVIAGPFAGGMELSWTGQAGKFYGVQTNVNLTITSGWGTHETGLRGDGGILSVTNTISPNQTFYRVISE